jgi:hypothetical protein
MEPSWNTCNGARAIAEKVREVLGHTHVDVGSPSHWHMDHMGYAGSGGFWCLIEEDLLTFDMILDRDGGVWKGDNNGNGECDEEEIEWHNAGTVGGTAINWVSFDLPYSVRSPNQRPAVSCGIFPHVSVCSIIHAA